MKPTKTFKLSKRSKTIGALSPFKDQDQRDAFKNIMIQAQLASEIRAKPQRTRDVNNMPVADSAA